MALFGPAAMAHGPRQNGDDDYHASPLEGLPPPQPEQQAPAPGVNDQDLLEGPYDVV